MLRETPQTLPLARLEPGSTPLVEGLSPGDSNGDAAMHSDAATSPNVTAVVTEGENMHELRRAPVTLCSPKLQRSHSLVASCSHKHPKDSTRTKQLPLQADRSLRADCHRSAAGGVSSCNWRRQCSRASSPAHRGCLQCCGSHHRRGFRWVHSLSPALSTHSVSGACSTFRAGTAC